MRFDLFFGPNTVYCLTTAVRPERSEPSGRILIPCVDTQALLILVCISSGEHVFIRPHRLRVQKAHVRIGRHRVDQIVTGGS
uniref:Uncharacterized protein n=1 Tax=Tanacetum cinerariifolium TaxID=118510 RepID=A0A699TNJ2_TANCI|nr:hypothetical protein [Tanacetum cinerariifolium]